MGTGLSLQGFGFGGFKILGMSLGSLCRAGACSRRNMVILENFLGYHCSISSQGINDCILWGAVFQIIGNFEIKQVDIIGDCKVCDNYHHEFLLDKLYIRL